MRTQLRLMLCLPLALALPSYATDRSGDNWFFGNNGGVSFASGSPVALSGGQMSTNEGCATISDSAGNLLFYTDGIRVWNRNHQVMPNGTGLLGDSSSTQSAVVVPKTGSTTIFYVFTADTYPGGADGLNYSTIDMTLDSGNGDIVSGQKNINLMAHCAEELSATTNANRTGVWVMGRAINSNAIHAFLVSTAGVNTTPVISNVGTATGASGEVGYFKPSPDGTKLAMAYYLQSKAELYDFDPATGQVSNVIGLGSLASPYGVEFSLSGEKLYISLLSGGKIVQYDLTASDIPGSKVDAASVSTAGAMQLGPDGKIYVTRGGQTSLSVINSPETAGTGCDFQLNAVSISGTCTYGLPTFIQSTFAPPTTPGLTTDNVSAITATTATCGGLVTSEGGASVTARGVCWSSTNTPTITDNHTTNGTGAGSFTSSLTSLSGSTTYYVRAYATNSVGTAYGNTVSFTTSAAATTATLTSTAISAITINSASSGGNISADGGASVTDRGLCWSTSPHPTPSDSHTSNGTGTGSFTGSLTGLTPGTTYYVRAYAINSAGTAYGQEFSFTTETDSDGDSVGDSTDACPNDASKSAAGVCGCGVADTDADSDGTPDCTDQCPADLNKTEPGTCGCGVADMDTDGDGTPDCNDQCPSDSNKTAPGACGCGTADTDSDGDGTPDCNDGCPNNPNLTAPGANDCSDEVLAPVLEFTIVSNQESSNVGENVAFTVGVINTGSAEATQTSVTIPLPPNTEFVSARILPDVSGSPVPGDTQVSNGLIVIYVGQVTVGQKIQIELVLKAASGAEVSLSGSVQSTETNKVDAFTQVPLSAAADRYVEIISKTGPAPCGAAGAASFMAMGMLLGAWSINGRRRQRP